MAYQIYLDTRTSDGTSNYDTKWYFNHERFELQRDFTVTLRTVEFPNLVYPTNEFNNVISFTPDSVTALTVTLTPGVYNGYYYATTLAAEMQALLRAYDTPTYSAATISGSFNVYTQKITLTSSVPIKFVLVDNSAYEQMGFDESLFDTAHTTWTSAFPVHLSGTTYVDVVTNMSVPSYNLRNTGHLLCRIQVDQPFGYDIYYKHESPDFIPCTTRHLDFMEITLYDDHGNLFKLPDNAHLSMVLTLNTELPEFTN